MLIPTMGLAGDAWCFKHSKGRRGRGCESTFAQVIILSRPGCGRFLFVPTFSLKHPVCPSHHQTTGSSYQAPSQTHGLHLIIDAFHALAGMEKTEVATSFFLPLAGVARRLSIRNGFLDLSRRGHVEHSFKLNI